MKRKRASLKAKLETPLTKKKLQITAAKESENHVIKDESEEREDPRTSSTIKKGRQEVSEIEGIISHPNALSHIIASVLKEITKDAGGLANLSRSLVGNSISNGQMEQPHADMDFEENESQHHQKPECKQEELNAALKVIKKTMKLEAADPFNKPVDPIALGIPDYFDVIKTPMDFGTICNNLENGLKYMNSGDVLKDVEYIWDNCVKYNKKGDVILDLLKRVKTYFMKYWKAAGLQIEPVQAIVESSILKHNKQEKDNRKTPLANKSGPNQLAESQRGQPQQSSNLPQSSSSPDEDDPNISTPDTAIIQKTRRFRGPTRCPELFYTGERIKIITNELGQPVGPGAAKLTTFVGVIARDVNFAPLTYNWSKIPQQNKENMWQKVLTKFDIDPDSRRWVMLSIRNKWRTFKSRLKANHYDVHETDEDRLADRDERVPPDQWSALVSHWSSEKSQNISAKLKAVCSRIKFRHTAGPKSYARIREEERAKRPDGQEPSQAELFILTRTRKDGKPVNEATAAVISQLCEETSCNKDISEDDAYNRVMKPYKNGGLSLYELGGTPATSRSVGPTHAEALKMVDEKNAEVLDLKERLSSVEQTCSLMAAQVAELVSIIKGNHGNLPNHVDGNSDKSTSNHEVSEKQTRGRKKRSELNKVAEKEPEHDVPVKKSRGRPKKR